MTGEGNLFAELVVSGVTKPKTHRVRLVVSLVLHTATIAALVLVPVLWPEALPETKDALKILIYNPPPAAAAPMMKGSSLVRKITPPKKVAEKEEKPKEPEKKPQFVVPIEIPKEMPKEERVAAREQYGIETGSDAGIPEGMEGGVEGGVAGGIPGGVVGGCVGCTGDGPVLDFDQPPRLLKETKPEYPQEAFVKKIEGNILVEILIDGNGRVVRARVLRSVPALDLAAIACVKQWVFAPAMKRGRAVATLAQANVAFRIF